MVALLDVGPDNQEVVLTRNSSSPHIAKGTRLNRSRGVVPCAPHVEPVERARSAVPDRALAPDESARAQAPHQTLHQLNETATGHLRALSWEQATSRGRSAARRQWHTRSS